ncbi:MAG: DUF1491 family protein [Candidatus Symbiobacter sp.]|nr:DUF1491 family protein [Candidatus Symbiobacter sp.]
MSANERLASYFRVSALVRQAELDGDAAYIRHKGDPSAGAVLVKHCERDASGQWHCQLRSQITRPDGAPDWMQPHQAEYLSETEAEDWIRRAIKRDQDLWVIETEAGTRVVIR